MPPGTAPVGRRVPGAAPRPRPRLPRIADGVATIVADRMSSGWLTRSCGYAVRRFDGLVAGRPSAATATPSPDATISRQPIRSGYETSSNEIDVAAEIGAASVATNVHSIRIVDRPPSPAGKLIAAAVRSGDAASPADRQPQSRRLLVAGGRLGGGGLGVADRAVAVGVDPLALLERRDLGHVDDDVEADLGRGDGDPREVVDREVAERVGVGRPRRRPARRRRRRRRGRLGSVRRPMTTRVRAGSPKRMTGPPSGLRRYTRPVTPSHETPSRGWFITIEGPEGAGKTTQAARLEAYLRDDGIPTIRTREPGGTVLGERIRDLLLDADSHDRAIDPLADALLFNAARRQLVAEVIGPALAAGTSVVCARYADSTLAYQGYGAGLPIEDLRALAGRRDGRAPARPHDPARPAAGGRAPAEGAARPDAVRARLRPRLPPPRAGRLPRARGDGAGADRRRRCRRRARPRCGRPSADRSIDFVASRHRPVNRNGPANAYSDERPGRRALGTRRNVD